MKTPLRIDTRSRAGKKLEHAYLGYIKVNLTNMGEEMSLTQIQTPQPQEYILPAMPKSQSLSPLLALAQFADETSQGLSQSIQIDPSWMREEHIASPDSSSLPSPWEISNPFDDTRPSDSINYFPSDNSLNLEPGEPRWLHVRVSMPHIVHRDLDVAGRAISTTVHQSALHSTAGASVAYAQVPPPTLRRARSQEPLQTFGLQRDAHSLRFETTSSIRKSVTTDYLNVFIPDHAIAF